MGSSDLNLKKSWHVGRAANITATAKAEAAAIEERKKTAARLAEIREERKKEEIQKQLAATTGKVVQERVEWMYSGGPSDGANGDSAANEAYLLGKRSLNNLLQDQEAKKLSKQASLESFAAVQKVAGVRETAAKIREDPLLAIKRQEQQAYEAVMNDPIKRRQLLAQMGIDDSKPKSGKSKDKEERRHKHRHHHRHRHDSRSDEERSTRKRRRSDSRERSRSRSRYDSDDDDHRRRTRRVSPDDRRSRRHSPERRRSYSPRDEKKYNKSRDGTRREPSRSRSPPRKRRDDSRDRSDRRDSYRGREDHNGRDNSYKPRGGGYGRERQWNGGGKPKDGHSRLEKKPDEDEERRARKLAEMQSAASELDIDRERRLKALEEAERAAREAEEKARQRSSKIGGDRHFMNGLQLKATGDMDLADRLGRGKKGLVRDED
ncbi:Pre-mRNA splicing factor and CIR domain protein [Coniochaeta hoffmannii]|uniref:Pre-mRNA splicing factor and CIR domain protein n=1 Tax=Coniochaeta hoffmannii TaxID=91930 RepID=A0AA38VF19_9PEZI|nr:Pre-mRNA splicing factor and CIR domain protein [Coniochaeta hoffmannii]